MIGLLYNRPFWWIVCAVELVAVVLVGFALLGEKAGHVQTRKQLAVMTGRHEAAVRDLGHCKAEQLQLRTELDSQNAKVTAWKVEAAAREARAEKRAADARREAARYRTKAERLLAATAGPENRCEAASRLYIEAVGGVL